MVLTRDLGQDDRGGGGDVKGVHVAVHGDGHNAVAGLLDHVGNAVSFTAHDQGAGASEIGIVVGRATRLGGVDPHARLFQLQDGGMDIGHLGYGQMLHSACGGLGHQGGQPHGATAGDNQAMSAAALGATNECLIIFPMTFCF